MDDDMSDGEADRIIVAMTASNGLLGHSFEVDRAAAHARPLLPATDSTPPAQSTRLIRIKSQLCVAWKISMDRLDSAFDTQSRDFFSKLARLAQLPLSFDAALPELERARELRIGARGLSKDRHWAPSDVDRAIEAIQNTSGRHSPPPIAAGGKRRATTQPTDGEQQKRRRQEREPDVHELGEIRVDQNPARLGHNHTPMHADSDIESDRASVPRAASVARETERHQTSSVQPRHQTSSVQPNQTSSVQPQPSPTHDPPAQEIPSSNESPDIHAVARNAQIPNGTPPRTNGLHASTNDAPQPATQLLDQNRANTPSSDIQSEALRRLQHSQTLPPHIFDLILQTFCRASASHVAVPPILASSSPPSHSPFYLKNYRTILLPVYLDNRWTLASIDLERKEAKLYAPTSPELNATELVTQNFLTTSLKAKDVKAWKMARILIAPSQTSCQDRPIICLVTAIHIIAGVAPAPEPRDTAFWREILAAFVKHAAAGPGPEQWPSPSDPPDARTTAALAPPPSDDFAALFARLRARLARERAELDEPANAACVRTRLQQLVPAARTLAEELLGGAGVARQLRAYAAADAASAAAVRAQEATVETFRQIGEEDTVTGLERYIGGLRAARRANAERAAALREVAERGGVEGEIDGLEERERARLKRLDAGYGGVWEEVERLWKDVEAEFGHVQKAGSRG